MDKILLKFASLSNLLVLQKVVYLIRQISARSSLRSLLISSFLLFSPIQTYFIGPSE